MLKPNVKQTIEEIKQEIPRVVVHALTQTPVTINEVKEAVSHLGENRDYVIKSILAVYLSTFLENKDPIWLMIVGNPSSNKTTLVDLLSPLENDVYKLDSLTSNPFSSGQRASENPQDLLPLIDGKCFIIKEYGTLLGKSDETVKQLIGDLVAIYDGEFAKHSPTRGTIRYYAQFSHIGCVTPMALSSRQKYMSAVGPRFLFLRIQPLSDAERSTSLGKIWSDEVSVGKDEVSQKVCSFCLQKKEQIQSGSKVSFDETAKTRLNNLANLTARARGIVISDKTSFKDEDGNTKNHYEVSDIQIEEPFRALKQLKKFSQCLAIVNGNQSVGDEELDIVKKVVLSSMPVRRADVLSVFNEGQVFTAKTASEKLDKNYRTVKRNFDELVALRVLKSTKDENQKARTYSLRDEFKAIFPSPEISDLDIQVLFNN